jgi:6-phosphofructo-2-kinase/fructose-2,6-biphosphatase 4
MDPDEAAKLYLQRINQKIPDFETMDADKEKELNFVKIINAGQKLQVNNVSFGYISLRIVFYLMNLHIKDRQVYFARAGTSDPGASYKKDAGLSKEGEEYAALMTETLINHREAERAAFIAAGGSDSPLRPLAIWTSTRRRTAETAEFFANAGYRVQQRSEMSQLQPGICEMMSEEELRRDYPDEITKHERDPYHHRYPRAEVSLGGSFVLGS